MAGLPRLSGGWLAWLVSLALLLTPALSRGEGALDAEVGYLLEHVRTSSFVFIRNGKEHNPEEAAGHMQRKYDYYRKRVKTAEDFIEYSATKSTMSGRKYTIRLADGTEVIAQDYLLGVLEEYRTSQ